MTAEDRTTKEAEPVEEAAEEMQEEIDRHERGRLEEERDSREDLNQGMATGTHDFTHRGVNWPASYKVRRKATEPKAPKA